MGLTGKVAVVVTDNDSNMVAAFRTYVVSPIEEDDNEDDGSEDDSEDHSGKVSRYDDSDECELEHDEAFESTRRIGCFTHTVQLAALNLISTLVLKTY